MKNKKILYIVLGSLLALLIGSSIYTTFIAKTSAGFTYLLIGQMFIGIAGALTTLFLGLKAFENKKNHELLFMTFLEILLVLGVVTLNWVFGYGKVINPVDYFDYMGYASMEFNIILYGIFTVVMGLLALNAFINEKLSLMKVEDKNKNNEEKAI